MDFDFCHKSQEEEGRKEQRKGGKRDRFRRGRKKEEQTYASRRRKENIEEIGKYLHEEDNEQTGALDWMQPSWKDPKDGEKLQDEQMVGMLSSATSPSTGDSMQ